MACGAPASPGLTIPRGATISVRLYESLDSETSKPGDQFRALLSTPLQQNDTTYVPLDAEAEGVVEESEITVETDPRARISLRLTGLQAPNGEMIQLRTVPVVRESAFTYQSEDIEVTTGLDVDLGRLLGQNSSDQSQNVQSVLNVRIPANSPLVFTLQEDVTFPPP